MRWFFSRDESEAFEQSIEMRLRRADAWASDRRSVFDTDAAREALLFRHDSSDGRLGYWTAELVREFLLEIVPERFTGDIEQYTHVPEALRTWLRFLDASDALHPHGAALADLEAAVDEHATDFPAAFADPAARRTGGPARMPALPAAELPDAERAAALARDTEAIRGAAALLDWIGKGRTLTPNGHLRKGDAAALVELLDTGDDAESFTTAAEPPGMDWYLELLTGTGLARRVGQRLVPDAEGAERLGNPSALLQAAWGVDALWRPGPSRLVAPVGENDPSVPRRLVASLLATAPDMEAAVAEIGRRCAGAAFGDRGDADDARGHVATTALYQVIDHVLITMHRFGAIAFDGAWERGEDLGTITATSHGSVRLTELGRKLVWTEWRDDGMVAPVVGELTECPAAVMLGTVVDHYGEQSGVEEIRRWTAANGDDPERMVAAIAANPFRTRQSAMLSAAADALGPELLERARVDTWLRPIAITLLDRRGLVDMASMMVETADRREEVTLGLADQILESVEQLGPEAFVESVRDYPQSTREGMAPMIAGSGHPDRWLVDLFAAEVAPILAETGARSGTSSEQARGRPKPVKRRRRPKRRRR